MPDDLQDRARRFALELVEEGHEPADVGLTLARVGLELVPVPPTAPLGWAAADLLAMHQEGLLRVTRREGEPEAAFVERLRAANQRRIDRLLR